MARRSAEFASHSECVVGNPELTFPRLHYFRTAVLADVDARSHTRKSPRCFQNQVVPQPEAALSDVPLHVP